MDDFLVVRCAQVRGVVCTVSSPGGLWGWANNLFVGIEIENWIPTLITRYPLTIFQLLPPLLVG